ncbi:MAG: aminopeptidase P family protein [Pseudomonadota bacterium]|nr:aminopeptidase P family protein [Pseudomonadota bacterium]
MTPASSNAADRIDGLRAHLAACGLDGWFVGREDMFQGEEVPAADERLAFISGFTGSAGYGLILTDCAGLFSDGRYTLQMANQSDPAKWHCFTLPEAGMADFLAGEDVAGARIGIDPRLVTVNGYARLARELATVGASLVAHQENPIDMVWRDDRPPPPVSRPFRMPDRVAGMSMDDKLAALDKGLDEAGCDAVVISRADAVNWLVNIRGTDLSNTPINLLFALYHRDNGLILIGDVTRLAPVMEGDLANKVAIVPLAKFDGLIDPRAGYGDSAKVMFDPDSLPKALHAPLLDAAIDLVESRCPVTAMKALKNEAELAGTRRAHLEDGAVMARFLCWLDSGAAGDMRETEIAAHLLALRSASPRFLASSFEAICGSGPNGAIVHYRALAGADLALVDDSLLLVDSGAHYNDGTTDITRTVAIGTPDRDMIHAFTAVLRGHIAVARARFPAGTTGQQIDALARAPMWSVGLDYAHGTGHGVGHVMQVHEGPASISKRGSVALDAGMLLSNEPGFYRAGEWGIRTENLIAVNPPADDGFLSFETITLCPIDRRLIDVGMLLPAERDWLNAYHARVRAALAPELKGQGEVLAWLEAACAPI